MLGVCCMLRIITEDRVAQISGKCGIASATHQSCGSVDISLIHLSEVSPLPGDHDGVHKVNHNEREKQEYSLLSYMPNV